MRKEHKALITIAGNHIVDMQNTGYTSMICENLRYVYDQHEAALANALHYRN